MKIIIKDDRFEAREESIWGAALAGIAMIGCVVAAYFLLLVVSVSA